MATAVAAFAAGDAQEKRKADESGQKLPGRKRRTVWLTQQPRPLFVAETEYKAAKYFTRVKKTLLVLYGAELLVVDVAALEAADSAAAAAGDMSVAVLRLISYAELLEVSQVGPASLKIEFGDSSDKPKMAGILFGALGSAAGAGAASSDPSSLSTVSAPQTDAYSSSPGQPPSSQAGAAAAAGAAASIRVTYDSFTLAFKDTAAAQEAAAALLYQRAQDAAARQWLYQGLHAGFRCDPVSLTALPLNPSSSSSSRVQQQGSVARAAAAVGPGPAPAPYPWGSITGGWGCSVPLPAGWGSILADAAAGVARDAADQPDISMDDLSCPASLANGPEALQLLFSTPLGVARAIITPQHVRAALLNTSCKQVLAVPAHKSRQGSSAGGSAAQHKHHPEAGFSWTVAGRVHAGTALDGSSGNLAAVAGVASSAPSASSLPSGAPGALDTVSVGAAGGFVTNHTVEAFAAVTVEVVKTPQTVGRRGVGRIYNPDSSTNKDSLAAPPAPAAAAAAPAVGPAGAAADSRAASIAGAPAGDAGAAGVLSNVEMVHMAVLATLAALTCMQLSSSSWALGVLQLLLVAGATYFSLGSTISRLSSRGSSSRDSTTGGSKNAPDAAADSAAVAASPFAAAAGDDTALNTTGGSISGSEDTGCCGWSLVLVTGDVVSVPGRYLQLQISMARADKRLTALRQRWASMSMSSGGLVPPLLSMTGGVPVLVSDPEPAWLHPDNKQRFLNAKPTLEASREQAQRTHKWRLRADIDNVLRKPCPGFDAISATFPTYTLLDNSPDGHAVVMMKVGSIKDLCDLVFNPPAGRQGVTMEQVEQTLAVLNEYLVLVAAPNPLPAGFQVQLYDMEGFKLSYVMGDMITLFKLLVRFGHYYPERLHQALVINAPGWFTYPWKLLSSFLDANTSAKVVVVGSPKSALATIAHHMGGVDNVPVAWGGKNTTPLDQFPAHKRMLEFARRLNAGEQPLQDLKPSGQ